MKFVLIVWAANSFNPFTQAAFTAEFDTYENCNAAWKFMHQRMTDTMTMLPDRRPRIVGGCFKK